MSVVVVVENQRTVLLPVDGVKGVLLGTAAILGGVVAMIYQLIGFHCMLMVYGMTTYDFIVNEQRKERDKASKLKEEAALKIKARQTSPGGAPPRTSLGKNINSYDEFKQATKKVPAADPGSKSEEHEVLEYNIDITNRPQSTAL
jgi:hypothetical protein